MSNVKHTAAFQIDQPKEKVFQYFRLEGGKLWVPGWGYENVMDTADLHEDDASLTKNHDHASMDAMRLV